MGLDLVEPTTAVVGSLESNTKGGEAEMENHRVKGAKLRHPLWDLLTIEEVVDALADWEGKGVDPLLEYLLSVGSTSEEEIRIAADVFNELKFK